MNTTRPTRGAARAGAIATLAGLALTGATLAGAPTIARWAAPVSGSFTSSGNWIDGLLPGGQIGAVIDAAGAPYTVSASGLSSQLFVPTLTIDSHDATLRLDSLPNFRLTLDSFAAHRGVIESNRSLIRFSGQREFDIGSDATLRVLQAGQTGIDRGYLALTGGVQMRNSGAMHLERNTILEAPANTLGGGVIESSLVNEQSGVIRSDAAFSMSFRAITNLGLMEFRDRPTGEDGVSTPTLVFGGVAPLADRLTQLNHSGEIHLVDADVRLLANLQSSGLFSVDTDSTLTLDSRSPFESGSLSLQPGTNFVGGGRVILNSDDASGVVIAENNLTIRGVFHGSVSNAGATTLRGISDSGAFAGSLNSLSSEGRLNLYLNASGVSIADDFTVNDGLEVIRASGTTSTSINVGGNAHLAGDINLVATSLTTGADLTIAPAAVITTSSDITVGANLNSGALDNSAAFIVAGDAQTDGSARVRQWRVGGVTTVSGNLTTTQGTATLHDGSTITGTLTAPSASIQGSVAIGSYAATTNSTITIDGELTLTSDTTLAASRIVLTTLSGHRGDSTSRIHADVVLTRPANTLIPSLQTSIDFDDNNAHTLEVLGSMSIEGRLTITFLGGVSGAYLGQSFTLIHATEGLTGQFDPLSLPTLADGLSLELVYDAHSLTLRVIPAPGPAALLALTGIAATRRRRA